MKTARPFGSWPSPLSAVGLAGAKVRIGEVRVVGETVYWIESRPQESGRSVVVRLGADGVPVDLVPPGFSARSAVHEYGGGAYAVEGDSLYFCNFADHGIYVRKGDGAPRVLVVEEGLRFADLVPDPGRDRLICVAEDHRGEGEAENRLVSVSTDHVTVRTLEAGQDFYASACIAPDGRSMAWLSWRHPKMPWDGSELWLATIDDDGHPRDRHLVAGGEDESIFQPRFAADGALWFVSDRSGYWNLYRSREGHEERVVALDAEIGQPQWAFGMSVYALGEQGDGVFAACDRGRWTLNRLDDGGPAEITCPYTDIRDVQLSAGRAVFVGGAADRPTAIARLDMESSELDVLHHHGSIADEMTDMFAIPEVVEASTSDGETTYGLFYSPTSSTHGGLAGELPPLLVLSHGGPTASATTAMNLEVQFWTSRGFAVADVNYRGSTGFGRAYRNQLDGRWGIVDVDDCCAVALSLADAGRVDRDRLVIRGGSAGGYTTLAALTFRGVFRAGASYYGIGDLEALVADTHKFESRYLDRLIGRYPEDKAIYVQRSPLRHAELLSCPVIFFQGLEDMVVPPSQAETMVAALEAKGVPVAYVPFEGEQHGFRRAENISRALECELYFYSRVLGFEYVGDPPDLVITNLG